LSDRGLQGRQRRWRVARERGILRGLEADRQIERRRVPLDARFAMDQERNEGSHIPGHPRDQIIELVLGRSLAAHELLVEVPRPLCDIAFERIGLEQLRALFQALHVADFVIKQSLFQNSWGSRVFEGVSGLGVGQAGAGSYLNSLIS